ncbi:MAG: tetratricopeptide repeat protein [Planctomycetota bacterium]|jgi:tetratricopeptide (TPR) repeat protein
MVAIKRTSLFLLLVLFVGLFTLQANAKRGHSRSGAGKSGGHRSSHGRSHSTAKIGRHGSSHNKSSIGRHGGRHQGSGIRRHKGAHHKSGFHNKSGHHKSTSRYYHSGLSLNSWIRRRGTTHHNSSVRQDDLHKKSGTRHHSGVRHRRYGHHGHGRHHGHHNRHRYYYSSVPYYYYYGYPYYYYDAYPYYYFSLPYYRYYYSYPYYGKPYPPDDYDYSDDKDTRYGRSDVYGGAKGKIEQQKADEMPDQPGKSTEYVKVDQHLKDIAEAFAAGRYDKAAERSTKALNAEPDDPLLPFVYSQSLFADQRYSKAASVLREALRKVDIDEQGVFYSHGFYTDQAVLTEQIEKLSKAVETDYSNADLNLVLGYQLLGTGTYDRALRALRQAQRDYVNKEAATALIEVLEKARADNAGTAEEAEPAGQEY